MLTISSMQLPQTACRTVRHAHLGGGLRRRLRHLQQLVIADSLHDAEGPLYAGTAAASPVAIAAPQHSSDCGIQQWLPQWCHRIGTHLADGAGDAKGQLCVLISALKEYCISAMAETRFAATRGAPAAQCKAALVRHDPDRVRSIRLYAWNRAKALLIPTRHDQCRSEQSVPRRCSGAQNHKTTWRRS